MYINLCITTSSSLLNVSLQEGYYPEVSQRYLGRVPVGRPSSVSSSVWPYSFLQRKGAWQQVTQHMHNDCLNVFKFKDYSKVCIVSHNKTPSDMQKFASQLIYMYSYASFVAVLVLFLVPNWNNIQLWNKNRAYWEFL